jgi:GntR family transcriptional regulator
MLRSDGIPLYHQLKEIFLEKIASGEWPPGEHIPPEGRLCADYGVSRGPVRQALDQLVREGLLTRKQGKGTWVLPRKIERSLGRLYSFTSLISQQGLQPAARLLSFETVQPGAGVERSLALAPGQTVYKIARIRLADGEPLVLETIHVSTALCPGLTAQKVEEKPLYAILEVDYRLLPARARQYFEAVVADEFEARLLGIAPGAPLLLLQNITYAANGAPVVLSKAILRGDRLRYYVDLIDAPGAPAVALPGRPQESAAVERKETT